VQVNDVIVRIGSKPVATREELTAAMQEYTNGDRVRVGLRRGDREMDVTATLGQRSATTVPTRAEMMNRSAGPLSKRATGFPVVIQHDTVLRPQDCGGPLVNLEGQAVAVNIARAGRTETYAIPADVVVGLIEELKSGRMAPGADAVSAEPPPTIRPATRPATRAATRATTRGAATKPRGI